MDEREFAQGYVDSWMAGRKKVSHKELSACYRRAKKLHGELYGKDKDAPYFGFCDVVANDLED